MSFCVCTHSWAYHYAPNDVSVIQGHKLEGACARCDCREYRHHTGPVPKPRPQASDAAIALVRKPRPTYIRPVAPRPVRPGTRNTYSDDREIPL